MAEGLLPSPRRPGGGGARPRRAVMSSPQVVGRWTAAGSVCPDPTPLRAGPTAATFPRPPRRRVDGQRGPLLPALRGSDGAGARPPLLWAVGRWMAAGPCQAPGGPIRWPGGAGRLGRHGSATWATASPPTCARSRRCPPDHRAVLGHLPMASALFLLWVEVAGPAPPCSGCAGLEVRGASAGVVRRPAFLSLLLHPPPGAGSRRRRRGPTSLSYLGKGGLWSACGRPVR